MRQRSPLLPYGLLVLLGLLFRCGPPATDAAPASAPPTLKDALAEDFLLGTALSKRQLRTPDPAVTELVRREFSAITPENDLKWENIHLARDTYDFAAADAYVDFGEAAGLHTVGHTLVWHSQLPDYVGAITDSAELADHLTEHITTIVGRYRGRIDAWDVVNEALNEDGSLRASHFLQVMGEDYLAHAFRTAAAADPDARLIYNDFNLWNPEKRAGVVRLVRRLQAAGVKIDAVGMQGHWNLEGPALGDIENSIVAYADLGVEVLITELDVTVLPNPWDLAGAGVNQNFRDYEGDPRMNPYPTGLPDSVQRRLTRRYLDYFDLFDRHAAQIGRVSFWGVHDGVSWLNGWPIRGRTNYPLLFDRDLARKPAYDALLERAGGN